MATLEEEVKLDDMNQRRDLVVETAPP